MHRKVIAIMLCLVVTLSVLAVGCTKNAEKGDTDASFDETVSCTPLTAEGDDKLSDNPDRGYRTEFVFYVKRKQTRIVRTCPKRHNFGAFRLVVAYKRQLYKFLRTKNPSKFYSFWVEEF